MLALIGGTGFDRPGIIEDPEEIDMETPYGRPSAPLIFGRLGSRPIVFLRRHGVQDKRLQQVNNAVLGNNEGTGAESVRALKASSALRPWAASAKRSCRAT